MAFISRYPILDTEHVWASSMKDPIYMQFIPTLSSSSSEAYYEIKGYYVYQAFDPSKSLVNQAIGNSWVSLQRQEHNQRIWADLDSPYIIDRVYYENHHDTEPPTIFDPSLIARDRNNGAYQGSIWGSNIKPPTYGNYNGLTKLWEGEFIIHSSNNASDPHYITLDGTTPYQFYTIDIMNNYSGINGIGFRRIELQEGVSSSSTEIKSTSSSESSSSNSTEGQVSSLSSSSSSTEIQSTSSSLSSSSSTT